MINVNVKIDTNLHFLKCLWWHEIKLFILIAYKIVFAFNEKIKNVCAEQSATYRKSHCARSGSAVFPVISPQLLGSADTRDASRKKKKRSFLRRFQRGEHHFSFDGKQRENATIAKELPKPLPDCVQPAFTAVGSPLQPKGNVPNARFSFPLRFPDVVKIRFTFYGNVATRWSGSTFVCKRNKCQKTVRHQRRTFGSLSVEAPVWFNNLIYCVDMNKKSKGSLKEDKKGLTSDSTASLGFFTM